jgi:O-antigen chain-terminating methyltransferase
MVIISSGMADSKDQAPGGEKMSLKEWDVHADYEITSHRPIIGRLLVLGRRIVHGEVRRYVDGIVDRQSKFNRHIVDIIEDLFERIDKLERSASKTLKLEEKLDFLIAHINRAVDDKLWLSNLLEKRVEENIGSLRVEPLNYFLFEERYRGVEEEIKQRQADFIKYFKGGKTVLDIGCGRGEFLELLAEHGIGARGIDINEDMVLYCKRKGLDVERADAITYLSSLPDKSLDGVFAGQVIEHLQPEELISLVKLCYDKLKYGCYFIAETVNPLCLSVYAGFFIMDLSHVKPIHPETIRFLLESVGFRDIDFKFFSEFPEEAKLKKIDIDDNMSEEDKNRILIMNQNIERLNSLLFGFQDYAVIGKK